MIKLKDISKSYGEKNILKDFSCDFPESGFVAIIGPSGCGKTTLTNLILGLEKADKGTSQIEGSISVVFQENCLLPQKNVLFNTLLAAKDSKNTNNDLTNKQLENKAVDILTKLGLKNDLLTFVSDLSGGMARRVALARSLCLDANIYIMDEPLSGLDEATRNNVLDVIHEYTDKKGKLLIMVTHDPESYKNATKIINLGQ